MWWDKKVTVYFVRKNSCEWKHEASKTEKAHLSILQMDLKVCFFRAQEAQFEIAGTLPKLGFSILQKPFLKASYKVAQQTIHYSLPNKRCPTLLARLQQGKVHWKCSRWFVDWNRWKIWKHLFWKWCDKF